MVLLPHPRVPSNNAEAMAIASNLLKSKNCDSNRENMAIPPAVTSARSRPVVASGSDRH